MNFKQSIKNGNICLGIEFGSTRIKAALIDENNKLIEMGSFTWKDSLVKGLWTYPQKLIIKGLQNAYLDLKNKIKNKYNVVLTKFLSIGISAMMHGYIVLDKNDKLLTPFRTWRNTNTKEASTILSKTFNFNIPQRWSIAHLYQAILNNEKHVNEIKYLTTLAGYIHYLLTGSKNIGIGDASGMFPINKEGNNYCDNYVKSFDSILKANNIKLNLLSILPNVKVAGEIAGNLTKEGSLLIDPTGDIEHNIPLCPPEGDAQTGMVATNSIEHLTGNVSAGTSIFGMIVLIQPLKNWYETIDIVTTPNGFPVAMVHCNNCSTDLNLWVNIFSEYNNLINFRIDDKELINLLINNVKKSDVENQNIFSCNYHSGEPITNFENGIPFIAYHTNSGLNLSKLFRTFLYSCFATFAIGFKILSKENIKITNIVAHGGMFNNDGISQHILSSMLNVPVTVMNEVTAGGPYGIAILAHYAINNKLSLLEFLNTKVFRAIKKTTIKPLKKDARALSKYLNFYENCLSIEKTIIENFNK